MKTLVFSACLAVVTTVPAAGLKDPAEVDREWNESTAPSSPVTDDLSLRGTTGAPPPAIRPLPAPSTRTRPMDPFRVPPWGKPAPRLDAPNQRVPEVLPDNMPPGTKAWPYGGQTYWLLPLIPSREK